MGSRDRFPGNRSIGLCRGAQPHDGTCSSAVRPYCLRSKIWGSLRPHVHLCNNAMYAETRISNRGTAPMLRIYVSRCTVVARIYATTPLGDAILAQRASVALRP
ncbi:MAG: hypothetical protein VB125_04175 [Burkholderia sp.]